MRELTRNANDRNGRLLIAQQSCESEDEARRGCSFGRELRCFGQQREERPVAAEEACMVRGRAPMWQAVLLAA